MHMNFQVWRTQLSQHNKSRKINKADVEFLNLDEVLLKISSYMSVKVYEKAVEKS